MARIKPKPFPWGLFSKKALLSMAECDARINLWEGAVRSGKTISSIVAWLDYIKTGPAGDYLMIGKTERTLKRNILDVMQTMVGSKAMKVKQGEAWIYGRRIYLVGASDARAEGKIRGMTIAGAYGDEVTLWPEDFFVQLLARLSVPGARFFGTTNPDNPHHWLNKNYIKRAAELAMKVFHFDIEDNPNLDPGYVEALKKEYTGLWFKRFILGLWVVAQGAIFDMWDEDKHVRPAPIRKAKRWDTKVEAEEWDLDEFFVAVDYGTSNPCTFGLFGYKKTFPVYLVSEYYYDSKAAGRQKTDAEYGADFAKWLAKCDQGLNGRKVQRVYVDPSATSFKAELRKHGHPVKDADNSVADGLRFVGTLLDRGWFYVDPSCKATREEFPGYVWDGKAQDRGEDIPVKTNDHAMDRNRYGLFTHMYRIWKALTAK